MCCLAGALGLWLRQGMGFYLRVLFMGFLPRNTMTVTTAYIFGVRHYVHTSTNLCYPPPPPPPGLCHAHAAADFVKCALYCLIILFLQISLH
jgi:hypothetical protein